MKRCKNCVHWLDFADKHRQMPAGKRKACTLMVKDEKQFKYVPHPKLHGKRTHSEFSCDDFRANHRTYVKPENREKLKNRVRPEGERIDAAEMEKRFVVDQELV